MVIKAKQWEIQEKGICVAHGPVISLAVSVVPGSSFTKDPGALVSRAVEYLAYEKLIDSLKKIEKLNTPNSNRQTSAFLLEAIGISRLALEEAGER